MHIPDGILTTTTAGTLVTAAGWVGSFAGIGLGLARLEPDEIPRAGLLTSLFFVVSLIQIPMGPVAFHLVLTGLMGLVLGWTAFVAVFVATGLQWLFFGAGGLTTLGINTFNMAFPGVLCGYLFRGFVRSSKPFLVTAGGFAAGATAVLLSALLTALCVSLAGQQFHVLSWIVFASDGVLALGEGFITAAATFFLRRVQPEVFGAPLLTPESG